MIAESVSKEHSSHKLYVKINLILDESFLGHWAQRFQLHLVVRSKYSTHKYNKILVIFFMVMYKLLLLF